MFVELLAYSEAACYYNLLQYYRKLSLTVIPSDYEHEGRELSHLLEHGYGSHPLCKHKPHVRTPKMDLCGKAMNLFLPLLNMATLSKSAFSVFHYCFAS